MVSRYKKIVLFVLIFTSIFGFIDLGFNTNRVSADVPDINSSDLIPNLDISRFAPYSLETNISDADSVSIKVTGLNGEGGDCWDFYVNGDCGIGEEDEFNMINEGGDKWAYDYLYPDYLYSEMFFAPSTITWTHLPSNADLWKGNYHLFKFENSFDMVDDMSFWIEFNTDRKAGTTGVLFVYLIGEGEGLDYFEEDWRLKSNTALVGTISKNQVKNHTHSENCSHYLISLATDLSGEVEGLDISEDFWVVLYSNSVSSNSGWNMRYQSASLKDNDENWFTASANTWSTPNHINGAPDLHVHIARRSTHIDGINIEVNATNTDGTTSEDYQYYFGELPNMAPNKTVFLSPISEVYDGIINISWEKATDANINDEITYKIELLDVDKDYLDTLEDNTTDLDIDFDTEEVDDGTYYLKGYACDGELCTIFYFSDEYEDGFIVSNNDAPTILELFDESGESSGDVSINYTLVDSGSDLCNIEVEYYDGEWSEATYKGGDGTSNIESSAEGVNHIFIWDSGSDIGTILEDTKLRLRAYDGMSYSGWEETGTFTVDNINDIPIVEITFEGLGGTKELTIGYKLYDDEEDICGIEVQFLDGGNWEQISLAPSSESVNNVESSIGGEQHYVTWDTEEDTGKEKILTYVRIRAIDSENIGSWVMSQELDIDNRSEGSSSDSGGASIQEGIEGKIDLAPKSIIPGQDYEVVLSVYSEKIRDSEFTLSIKNEDGVIYDSYKFELLLERRNWIEKILIINVPDREDKPKGDYAIVLYSEEGKELTREDIKILDKNEDFKDLINYYWTRIAAGIITCIFAAIGLYFGLFKKQKGWVNPYKEKDLKKEHSINIRKYLK